ncbi:MAG TPA: acyl-CoA dehydrogenase family protein [Acidimicrobiia bacterium]|nr:acyl-CoA dehydrogenase family protein [Acidimicrobiia bacterium]
MDYRSALARVIDDVVEPGAVAVDRDGSYPRAQLAALGEAGILGLASSPEVGGVGEGLAAAAHVVEQLARHCGSTAMVVMMHYSATAVLEAHGPQDVREAIAAGRHVTTLAFSEVGSRSHFWAPLGTAAPQDGNVRLDAQKSWVTAAGEANSYVWSSRPVAGDGAMTLWLVPSDAPGLSVPAPFDGLGLRGNASSPVSAEGVEVPAAAMLGGDGAGLDIALTAVLPWFLVLNAAASIGLMQAVTDESTVHLSRTQLAHLGQSLAQQPVGRARLARMRIETDRTVALLADALAAIGAGREDAQLRVLEVKAAAGEAAIDVTDLAMQVCGGAAFRKELGIERRFRDARAARVMAPTTDALEDFIGRALCGLPLLDAAPA